MKKFGAAHVSATVFCPCAHSPEQAATCDCDLSHATDEMAYGALAQAGFSKP